MVGLCIANQLIEKGKASSILIIEKEDHLGRHSSGRNSGVVHAGIYYEPNTVKAKVCIEGGKRLKEWIGERGLTIHECGKVVVPTRADLDAQLDVLAERGTKNGASVEFLDEDALKEAVPCARSGSGRALWSPNTAVVKPLEVLESLSRELAEKGVRYKMGCRVVDVDTKSRTVKCSNGTSASYGHAINCAGLHADRIASLFGVGGKFSLLPFKGVYWKLKKDAPIRLNTNLYPVPNLSVPFLGVHFTPTFDVDGTINVGPTATPVFGRENYYGVDCIEPLMATESIMHLSTQFLRDGKFRSYVREQAFLSYLPFFYRAARELIPTLEITHLELSEKVGIRNQLYNKSTKRLEDDFLCLPGPASTHVMNAISPAFTSSFELADLIVSQCDLP